MRIDAERSIASASTSLFMGEIILRIRLWLFMEKITQTRERHLGAVAKVAGVWVSGGLHHPAAQVAAKWSVQLCDLFSDGTSTKSSPIDGSVM